MALKLHNKRWYPFLFLTGSVTAIAAWFYFAKAQRPELLISAVVAFAGFNYFLYRQHLDKARLFKELFVEFNDRYSRLNKPLNKILFGPSSGLLSADERDVLFSYFNLCAEEHFFYEAGYFDHRVWNAWYRGMKNFFDHPRIRELWDEDSKSDSYYGFRPPPLN
jgi:hypothetical protein